MNYHSLTTARFAEGEKDGMPCAFVVDRNGSHHLALPSAARRGPLTASIARLKYTAGKGDKPDELVLVWIGKAGKVEGVWKYRRMKGAVNNLQQPHENNVDAKKPDRQIATSKKAPATANTPQSLVKLVAAAYASGNEKAMRAAFHAPDEKSRKIADTQARTGLIAPKVDRFIELCKTKFGEGGFEAMAATSEGFSFGREVVLWWPMFADSKNITFESKGDIAVATHLQVVDGLRLHTQIRMKRVNGKWYLNARRNGFSSIHPVGVKLLNNFVDPAIAAIQNSDSFADFDKAIAPLLMKLDKEWPSIK